MNNRSNLMPNKSILIIKSVQYTQGIIKVVYLSHVPFKTEGLLQMSNRKDRQNEVLKTAKCNVLLKDLAVKGFWVLSKLHWFVFWILSSIKLKFENCLSGNVTGYS